MTTPPLRTPDRRSDGTPAPASDRRGTPHRPRAAGPGSARRVLRALAVVSCVPYLGLKAAWIAGSRVGIPDGSVLLEDRALMAAVNGVTVLMDGAVIVLALLLTQGWGLRVRAWLLALPMWAATGLLAPIMVGFPVQILSRGGSAPVPKEPFLDEWVFGVVYSGFIVQGLTLGALFALYARDRWGRVWRAPAAGPAGPWARIVAVVASVPLAALCAVHLMWATGSTAGLPARRIAERSSDFHALEGVRALFAVVAVAGVLALVYGAGRSRSRAPKVPLVAAWVGSGAVGCWGGYLLLTLLMPMDDPSNAPTALMALTYAGEMITGILLACCLAACLRRRAA
ncbi:hypothetical protein AB0A69_03855 [Streptomyces sp. NPDC045431]|uniref:hypothetical protein n=1 Tax=Streptomyces sp. NPDC045431 TaxID=3155613 RepID=UPI0033EA5C88